jgi:TATA-binding protein-associated factor Taf7
MSNPTGPLNTLYNLNGIPWFTYGMIGITTFALACVTMLDDSNKSFAKDDVYESTLSTNPITSGVSSISDSFSNMLGSSDKKETEKEETVVEENTETEETEETEPISEEKKESEEEEQKIQQESQVTPETENMELKKGGKKKKKTKSNIKKYQHNKTKSK